jgi:hypothetical protein
LIFARKIWPNKPKFQFVRLAKTVFTNAQSIKLVLLYLPRRGSCAGVNVMIIFGYFANFWRKNGVFLENQCYDIYFCKN